jgi:hypothetical protein
LEAPALKGCGEGGDKEMGEEKLKIKGGASRRLARTKLKIRDSILHFEFCILNCLSPCPRVSLNLEHTTPVG